MPPTKRVARHSCEGDGDFDPLELPPATTRWVVRRKAVLIKAVRSGVITLDEACSRYQLSSDEFASWLSALEKHGVHGLRATRLQIYRDDAGRLARKV
jgi:hypothetical protein